VQEVEIDLEKNLGIDYRYSGQCGYWIYAALRGDTPGRHLKRDVCEFGLVQLMCGIAFLVNMDKSGTFRGLDCYHVGEFTFSV
jgi:hypothetical protein